jgi:hypothetical protein
MFSAAYGYRNGAQQWCVWHDAQNGISDLSVVGHPPPAFDEIRARLSRKQDENGGDSSDVDFFFDIPMETAQSLCPYRHDVWRYAWGDAVFTSVEID